MQQYHEASNGSSFSSQNQTYVLSGGVIISVFPQYKPSDIELWISNKYQENGIFSPSDLDVERVADIFGYLIKGTHRDSGVIFDDEGDCIIYLKLQEAAKMRADFFHEICHPLRHVGDQSVLPAPFVDLQEAQAAQFQLYSSMPFYMIQESPPRQSWVEYYQMLAIEFTFPVWLVRRRILQINNRIERARWDQQFYELYIHNQQRPVFHSDF